MHTTTVGKEYAMHAGILHAVCHGNGEEDVDVLSLTGGRSKRTILPTH